jgi:fluoroacetyl-CoA thioesterase
LLEGMKPGISVEFSITVDKEMRPSFDGVVVHDVMSTVTMIYYMEKAGREVIFPYLENDEEGAGFAIDVKHVGPAVLGQEVRFKAVCTEATSKRVVCDVTAETELNLVGKGAFTQAIFKKVEMAGRIQSLQEKVRKQNN